MVDREKDCEAVDSNGVLPMLMSPENDVAGVPSVSGWGNRGVLPQWLGSNTPAGVAWAWRASTGVPREQVRPDISASLIRLYGCADPKHQTRKREPSGVVMRTAGHRTDASRLAVPGGEHHEPLGTDHQESESLHRTETGGKLACRHTGGANRNSAGASTGREETK